MIAFVVFGAMLLCAGIPFALTAVLVRRGQSGLALTIGSVIGASLAIFLYASGRPFGIDPVFAMGAALMVCVPALMGCLSGALLGGILRRQDDRRI